MSKTAISWTDATWNPVRGCSRVSEGCRHCYAEAQAARIVRMGKGKPTPYDGLVRAVGGEARWTGDVSLVPERLADPLTWRKPRRIFVNSMSDLFHESLSNEQIAAVFGVMAACPQHMFQCLTKRAARMREWFAWVDPTGHALLDLVQQASMPHRPRKRIEDAALSALNGIVETIPAWRDDAWPLPNVWLGVSVENQAAADERIPELLATPAAIRFLSCEPLLGEVLLTHVRPERCEATSVLDVADDHPRIDWVIAGCESGPGARTCDVAWLHSLRDQCARAGVPFWLKQAREEIERVGSDVYQVAAGPGSKRKAGGVVELPYLDGVQHKDWPNVHR
jgi:protein gp37